MITERCARAEVGLVEFAKCALAIAERVMPLYRSKYSKHTFFDFNEDFNKAR